MDGGSAANAGPICGPPPPRRSSNCAAKSLARRLRIQELIAERAPRRCAKEVGVVKGIKHRTLTSTSSARAARLRCCGASVERNKMVRAHEEMVRLFRELMSAWPRAGGVRSMSPTWAPRAPSHHRAVLKPVGHSVHCTGVTTIDRCSHEGRRRASPTSASPPSKNSSDGTVNPPQIP